MLTRDVEGLRLSFRPDGRGPGELRVERGGDLLLLDRVTLASAKRRAEIVGRLPEELRERADGALLELAAEAGTATAPPSAADALREDAREIVHGTSDLRPTFLLYGFRVERVEEGRVEEVPVRVISERTDAGLELRVLEGDEFRAGGRDYVVDPRWPPPLLEERWSRDGLLRVVTGRAEPPHPARVLGAITGVLRRHLDYVDAGAYPVLAALVMLSYVARAFSAVPYIGLLGPKGTGKSATLGVLERLAFNAYKGRVTAAALGDTTSALRGTVLVDQAHHLPEELVDLLVDGYRREGGRRRVVDLDNRGRPHEFETFGPKVFASARGVDPDLLDRLVVVHTAPAARPVLPLPAADRGFRDLRGALYAMALLYWPVFARAAEELEGETVRSRAEELWGPLEAVLRVCEAEEVHVEAARALYRRSVTETVAELGDWEVALLDELGRRVRYLEEEGELEVANTRLLEAVVERLDLAEEAPRPGVHWLGSALSHLNLLDGSRRRRIEGRRVRLYTFSRGRVVGQLERFGLPLEGEERTEDAAPSRPSRPPSERSGHREAVPRRDLDGVSRRPDRSGGSEKGGVSTEPEPWQPTLADHGDPDADLLELL